MISIPVAVAVVLFAMSTWISIVGVWVEMPLLVNQLPESWNLPSYLVIIIQCANLGPASYAIYDKLKPKNRAKMGLRSSCVDVEVAVSLVVLAMATLSIFLLSFLWSIEIEIAGEMHSIALLILVCFAALACCTSSVVFLPFMARLPSVYVSAYYFGQGLCGLLPGIAGLIQGAGKEPICINATESCTELNETLFCNSSHMIPIYSPPNFSISAFFGFICVLLCISTLSFCCLNSAKFFHCLKLPDTGDTTIVSAAANIDAANENEAPCTAERVPDGSKIEADSLCRNPQDRVVTPEEDKDIIKPLITNNPTVERLRVKMMLLIVGIVSALWNGILPATQSYTCLPYGNIAYTLSICLSWIVSPLATLPSMIAPTSSLLLVGSVTFCGVLLSAFHLVLASMSPSPILQGTTAGQFMVVSVNED